MARVRTLRLPDDLDAWAMEYAKSRGVTFTDLMLEGLRSFREGCELGVPEIRREKLERALRAAPVHRASEMSENEKVMRDRQAALNRRLYGGDGA